MNRNIALLRRFGLPETIVQNTVQVVRNDNYYWAAEKDDNKVYIYCAYDKNDIYDADDSTLNAKIVTDTNLYFRHPDIDSTLVVEKYISAHSGKAVYLVTSLQDHRCVYEK